MEINSNDCFPGKCWLMHLLYAVLNPFVSSFHPSVFKIVVYPRHRGPPKLRRCHDWTPSTPPGVRPLGTPNTSKPKVFGVFWKPREILVDLGLLEYNFAPRMFLEKIGS